MSSKVNTTGLATVVDSEWQQAVEALSAREKEVEKLRTQLKEMLHINHQWDLEYREQQESYDRYRADAQQAQRENQDIITQFKAEKEMLTEQSKQVRREKERTEKKLNEIRSKYDGLKRRYEDAASQVRALSAQLHRTSSPTHTREQLCRMEELKEENELLRQQLKMYQEDFEAERRDRERMANEKETDKLRSSAEITSLKLQLDRANSELSRMKSEASRLAQQLRLRQQADEERYRTHLESKGYTPRYPNQPLPPLDPYVEQDRQPVIAPGYRNPHAQYTSSAPHENGYNTHNGRVSPTSSLGHPVMYNGSRHPTPSMHLNRYGSNAYAHSSGSALVSGISTPHIGDHHHNVDSRPPRVSRIGCYHLYSRDVEQSADDVDELRQFEEVSGRTVEYDGIEEELSK